MIQASIVPTRPLRHTGSDWPPERKIFTRLRDSKSATDSDPVVLLRGCTEIDLRVNISGVSSPRVTWHVQGLRSNRPDLAPGLFPAVSMFSRLSTNAVGLYCVTATVAIARDSSVQHHWHVRFIDVQVPETPSTVKTGKLDVHYDYEATGLVCADATFGFKIHVVLAGAEDAPVQYEKVTVGILQNLFQKSSDPDCAELRGLYYRRQDTAPKTGEFVEPAPAVSSPHLDTDPDCSEFPFMHIGHVKVEPKQGSSRLIDFDDTPGIRLPMFLDTSLSMNRKDWRANPLSMEQATKSPSGYALYGVRGRVKFISAVAAFSEEAQYNYVVSRKFKFTMQAKAIAPGIQVEENPLSQPLNSPEKLGIPNPSLCFIFEGLPSLHAPADARKAEMETYGPVATKGGGLYTWIGPAPQPTQRTRTQWTIGVRNRGGNGTQDS